MVGVATRTGVSSSQPGRAPPVWLTKLTTFQAERGRRLQSATIHHILDAILCDTAKAAAVDATNMRQRPNHDPL
jgi:hypothetical protein